MVRSISNVIIVSVFITQNKSSVITMLIFSFIYLWHWTNRSNRTNNKLPMYLLPSLAVSKLEARAIQS